VNSGWHQRLRPWESALRVLGYVAALQTVGLLGVFVKHTFMHTSDGYLAASRFTGRLTPTAFTLLERLHFFAADLFLNLALIPVVAAVLVCLLPRRAQGMAVIAACVALALVHFVELATLSSVGQFISWDLFKESLQWFRIHPESAQENISASAALKLGLIIVGSALAALITVRPLKGSGSALLKIGLAGGALTLLAAGTALPAFARQPSLAVLGQSRAGLAMQLEAFAPLQSSRFAGLSAAELARRYQERVHAPSCPNAGAYFGSERGKDLILFVYETGPRRSFDAARKRAWLPSVEALAGNAFVATQHYTTYPYTSDAVFSILSGRYPLNRRNLIKSGQANLDDSLTQQLRRQGYGFHVYSSFGDAFEADMAMFGAFGASTVYVPDARSSGSPQVRARVDTILDALGPQSPMHSQPAEARVRERLAQDLAAFDRLSTDVLEMKRRGQRFAALYLPQIGHAPWFDLDGVENVVDRGAAVMRLQDMWLEELVESLRAEGRLESTVIVVTADHGVRTKNEDASFEGGVISDYSFHVPLVIYAPNAAQQTHELTQLTSHVDVASTVLSLLGVSEVPVAQGAPIWCDDLDQRATFFFARGYLGADGFRLGGSFVMHAALTGAVYESDSMDFLTRRSAPPEAAARDVELRTDVRQLTVAWNAAQRAQADRPQADRPGSAGTVSRH
jgi:hypothetical protein